MEKIKTNAAFTMTSVSGGGATAIFWESYQIVGIHTLLEPAPFGESILWE